MTLKTEYLIDERGHKKSIVISVNDYIKLLEYLEDLEDSIDLKKAKESEGSFKDFNKVVHDLKTHNHVH